MKDFLDIILSNTYTSDDAVRRLGLLKEYFETATYQTEDAPTSISSYFAGRERSEDVEAVAVWVAKLPQDLAGTFYEQIEEVTEAIGNVPVLVLYTPVALPKKNRALLGELVRTIANATPFIEYRVDQASVGGCCFVWRGTYHDYSLAHYMSDKHEVVSSYFNSHV